MEWHHVNSFEDLLSLDFDLLVQSANDICKDIITQLTRIADCLERISGTMKYGPGGA